MNSAFPPVRSIPDDRTHFTLVSLAWRTDQRRSSEAEQTLRAVADRVCASNSGTIWHDWAVSAGAVNVTAALPLRGAERWLQTFAEHAQQIDPDLAGAPALALVGPQAQLENLAAPGAELFGHLESKDNPGLSDRLERTTTQGYEQITVTGADPSAALGSAATFLALATLSGGPVALLPKATKQAGHAALIKIMRVLKDRQPAIMWQVIAQENHSLGSLESTLDAVADLGLRVTRDEELLIKQFAIANLNRAWCSPVELVRALAQYEVMGWGGDLILNPESQVNEVANADLELALEGLLRSPRAVLGKS
ncbi:hypothetical protein CIK76_08475 [Glutamicibacter sp. BW80]|uniref:hypothetical protein n=1 Tax=unclassified Glutamicibacter TaxID=2627139 RepID=UPI000BB93A47|nr:hypothetical protein [Glutamicibacter sp. BW80]PCC28752.1 hypothetical protein CIK76_08475 [Glutamicibacter sp. BW80]